MVDGLSELIMSKCILLTVSGELYPGARPASSCALRPSGESGGVEAAPLSRSQGLQLEELFLGVGSLAWVELGKQAR